MLVVTHDLDDEGWQFVNGHGDTDDAKNGMLVHPEHLVELDPSVISLGDLPLGWMATRADRGAPWVRRENLAAD